MSYCTPCELDLPRLSLCRWRATPSPTLELERFTSSAALPSAEWDQLCAEAAPLLNSAHLSALEGAQGTLDHHYLTLRRSGKLVAIAHLHVTSFHGPSVTEIISLRSPALSRALSYLRVGDKPLDAYVLVCGGSSASLGPSLYISPEVSAEEALSCFAAEAEAIMSASDPQRPIRAALFQGTPERSSLTDAGLSRFESEPIMSLRLRPDWLSFEDYLQSLSSKYRVKAKRADARSAQLQQLELDAHGARAWSQPLRSTYEQVTSRAPFCVQALEIDALPELLARFPERYRLHAYLLEGQLIGFRLSLIEGDTLHAQLVGIDYKHNRAHSLYPRMLNDYLREGIALGCHTLDFGRTASEIKSTLGATPTPSDFYLAHAHTLVNWSLPSISKRVSLTPYKQHKPFKVTPRAEAQRSSKALL